MEPGNLENRKFHEILTLITSEAIIFNEFSSLTRISLPCGAPVYYYDMIRRAFSVSSILISSNTVSDPFVDAPASMEQGVVPWNRKNSKIENFMKY